MPRLNESRAFWRTASRAASAASALPGGATGGGRPRSAAVARAASSAAASLAACSCISPNSEIYVSPSVKYASACALTSGPSVAGAHCGARSAAAAARATADMRSAQPAFMSSSHSTARSRLAFSSSPPLASSSGSGSAACSSSRTWVSSVRLRGARLSVRACSSLTIARSDAVAGSRNTSSLRARRVPSILSGREIGLTAAPVPASAGMLSPSAFPTCAAALATSSRDASSRASSRCTEARSCASGEPMASRAAAAR